MELNKKILKNDFSFASFIPLCHKNRKPKYGGSDLNQRVSILLSIACDDVNPCAIDPTKASCMANTDGGICPPVEGLQYLSVAPANLTTDVVKACGEYRREIVFQMPNGAPEDGYIVQRVENEFTNFSGSTDDDQCHPPDSDHTVFYELFGPIAKGKGVPYGYGCRQSISWENGELQGTINDEGTIVYMLDTNFYRNSYTAEGEYKATFSAQYYTFDEMGDYLPSGYHGSYWDARPQSGHACSSEKIDLDEDEDIPPPFIDGRSTVDRIMHFKWNCCVNGEIE